MEDLAKRMKIPLHKLNKRDEKTLNKGT